MPALIRHPAGSVSALTETFRELRTAGLSDGEVTERLLHGARALLLAIARERA